MVRDAGIPDVGRAQFADGGQRLVVEVGELADPILLDRAPRFVGRRLVTEQAREYLVHDGLSGRLRLVDCQRDRRMVPVEADGKCRCLPVEDGGPAPLWHPGFQRHGLAA